ncbi:nitrogen fixation protein FixH [bacterium]|nr:nitrogen fixation protein FixH [bacterium]
MAQAIEKPVRPFTGKHMLALTLSFFGVIIAVNIGLAYKAITTFPGLEVDDSYVASQTFDQEKSAQEALHWHVRQGYDHAKRQLVLDFTDVNGKPVTLRDISVLVGRPTEAAQDQHPVMQQGADGAYAAALELPLGKWMLQIVGHAQDGTLYQARTFFYVRS